MRKEYYDSFLVSGNKNYSMLGQDIQESNNMCIFTKKLKTHLLQVEYPTY